MGAAVRLLCLTCGTETDTGDQDLAGCPGCGDREHVAADLDDVLTVTITAHELRVLTMWADNWARAYAERDGGLCRKAMRVITDRLGQQVSIPRIMSQEIADLREHFGDVRVTDSQGREVDL